MKNAVITREIDEICYRMTSETMEAFIQSETQKGASDNMLRRFKCTLKVIYDYLPEDKTITKERLLQWRKSMEDRGYASITIRNYVKNINRYLDFVGCSKIRFNRGKAKDITNMTFGYLTAIEPTGEKNRSDIIWLCKCKCGKMVEIPATRLLLGNTLSCGCLQGEHLKRVNKYIDGTSLVKDFNDQIISTRSASGYVGVSKKRDKWQAYITYKGKRYSLGCYSNIDDAVKARMRAKELVIEDSKELLAVYEELEKNFPQMPNRNTEPKREFPSAEWTVNNSPASAARRSDNKSGYVGVCLCKGKWEARICYKGIRYRLGSFEDIADAISAREKAERLLKEDPKHFVEEYSKTCAHHHI